MTVSTAAPPAHRSSSPRLVYLAVAALGGAAASIYFPVLAGLGRQWYEDPNAAYGALVAVAAVVAVRQRWPRLRSAPIEGSWWGAAALLAVAALYALATLAADIFLLRTTCVLFGAAAIWFVCGTAHLRLMAAPLVLCMAAIPPPSAVVTEVTMPLQLAASQIAAGVLGGVGFEVVRDGNVLTLSYITLEVAEACSGMRSLVTLLALVAVYWGTGGPPLGRVAILALTTVPVALAGNGLRVVATAILASRMGQDAARGFVHDATGFAAFVLMCAALVSISVVTARCTNGREVAA